MISLPACPTTNLFHSFRRDSIFKLRYSVPPRPLFLKVLSRFVSLVMNEQSILNKDRSFEKTYHYERISKSIFFLSSTSQISGVCVIVLKLLLKHQRHVLHHLSQPVDKKLVNLPLLEFIFFIIIYLFRRNSSLRHLGQLQSAIIDRFSLQWFGEDHVFYFMTYNETAKNYCTTDSFIHFAWIMHRFLQQFCPEQGQQI